MSKDWDSVREMHEENERELQAKIQNDQYWLNLEARCGYGC